MDDAAALATAFKGAEGTFVLLPGNFDPSPGFPEAKATVAAVKSALLAAHPAKVVCISTIGAQAFQSNLLTQLTIMENSSWDVGPARENGVIQSFLQPLDKRFPMVATADVGRTAAELLQETWNGRRIVELEGPHRVTPNAIAAEFSKLLGRPVRMQPVPRDTWMTLFESQGMKNPLPRIQMLDGFNAGWIEFERGEANSRKGTVALESALGKLI
jgi:uncharacterized protein YbjT (DUF2867 family)